ncbi:GD18517 [Drosophila simulans]|uniref:GD18517 n=1 Tax=Drosophila simulans TaxID=7240 RepID=B4QYQ0_DROSI|nr:GD18517 [Drosophila simulans]
MLELQLPPSQKRVSQANRHRRPWNYSISNLSTIVGAHTEKSCEKEMESRNATASEEEEYSSKVEEEASG